MAKARRRSSVEQKVPHDQLLERIARRYEQLDEKLDELEAKLPEFPDRAEEPNESARPKPR